VDLRQLRYFSEVAAVGTFLGAAERLHVADSAVWKQVRALEQELGLTLFERVGRRVQITRAGELLLERVDLTLVSAERVRHLADDLRQGRSGTVVLACAASHIPRFVGPVLAHVERTHPEIEVELREYESQSTAYQDTLEKRLDDLMHGAIDLMTTPPTGGNVDGFVAFEGRLVAVLPPDDPRAAAGVVPIRTLRDQPLLVTPSAAPGRRLLDRACRAAGFEPVVKGESRNASTIVALGRVGHGIPVLVDYVLETATGACGTPLVDGDSPFIQTVWLYWRKGAVLLPAVQTFVEEARAFVAARDGAVN
jgi:DNA-binding transcriptional LysR family regulator